MYKSEQVGLWMLLESGADFVDTHRVAPVILHHDGRSTATFHILFHATAKYTVLADNDRIAGRDEVNEAGFHTGRTRCGHWQGEFIFGLERVLQQLFDLIHQVHKQWIQVADGRSRQGAQNAGRYIGGAGAHQRAKWRIKAAGHSSCPLDLKYLVYKKEARTLADFGRELKSLPEIPRICQPTPWGIGAPFLWTWSTVPVGLAIAAVIKSELVMA